MGVFASVPRGAHLQIDILSTWGDPHYVGLAALEIFDEHGEPVELEDPSSGARRSRRHQRAARVRPRRPRRLKSL